MQALPDDDKRAQAQCVDSCGSQLQDGPMFLIPLFLSPSHAESWQVCDPLTSVEVSLHDLQGRS